MAIGPRPSAGPQRGDFKLWRPPRAGHKRPDGRRGAVHRRGAGERGPSGRRDGFGRAAQWQIEPLLVGDKNLGSDMGR